jgi:hypothetical protein
MLTVDDCRGITTQNVRVDSKASLLFQVDCKTCQRLRELLGENKRRQLQSCFIIDL